jgi:hypothetical protein
MEKYFAYLDELRESGETNMLGAVPYLQRRFPELAGDRARAQKILTAWMHSFDEED